MKKVLVLVADYPNNNGGGALMFAHVRNKYYIQHDIDVTVLNFASKENYSIDRINVITLEFYRNSDQQYDILISHAANIRNHYRFLKKYGNRFERMMFFFHGHEVLKINEVYPEPYDYMKNGGLIKKSFQNLYDKFKLSVWHRYFKRIAYKSDFIFVSNWLYKKFVEYVKLTDQDLDNHVHIINNSVGSVFEGESYKYNFDKKYDFVTIRSNMDNSTYCIDLINKLANRYGQYRFLIIGRGKYYEEHHKPDNVEWINHFLSHSEILDYIDQSKCGLMLTRNDTQGVMTCEMAEYGIPVITSDIEVCQEMFGDIQNVALISNDIENLNISEVFLKLISDVPYAKQDKFCYRNTVYIEEQIIKE